MDKAAAQLVVDPGNPVFDRHGAEPPVSPENQGAIDKMAGQIPGPGLGGSDAAATPETTTTPAAEGAGSGESHIPRSGSEWEAKFKSESGDANVQRMTKDVEPEGMHGVAAKGQAGEQAAGITQKKVAVQGPISGKTRFPDEITGTTIKEVKNVAKQGWTAQLKDSAEIAKQTGKTFELWVRKSTVLSGPLQAAEKAGQVFIKYLKGL